MTVMLSRTLAGFLLGVGVAQLVYGPMADRFGRKLPLLLIDAGEILDAGRKERAATGLGDAAVDARGRTHA